MGIKDFNSFLKLADNNDYKVNSESLLVDTIIIDGSLSVRRSFYVAYKNQQDFYQNMFNINHIYQDICIRTAIIIFESVKEIIKSSKAKNIMIFYDRASKIRLDKINKSAKELVPVYLSEYYKEFNIKEVTQTKRIKANKVMINGSPLLYSDIKKKAMEQANVIMVNEEFLSFLMDNIEMDNIEQELEYDEESSLYELTKEELPTELTKEEFPPEAYLPDAHIPDLTNEEKKEELPPEAPKEGLPPEAPKEEVDFVSLLSSQPFITNFISPPIMKIILIIVETFIKQVFPTKSSCVIESNTEADFEIYSYVYHKAANENEKIMIVSKDTDYFICGYSPNVYIYDLLTCYHPYSFWKPLLFDFYDDSIDKMEILLRVSFAFGNDYLTNGILGGDNKSYSRLDKLRMLFNIDNNFQAICSIKGGAKLKNHYNINTSILNNISHPFSPEVLDLVVLTGLNEKDRIIYITSIYQLKYAIHKINSIEETRVKNATPDDIVNLLKSEISFNISEYNYNPFLIKRINTSKTLFDLMKDDIKSYINNAVFRLTALLSTEVESSKSGSASPYGDSSQLLSEKELTEGFIELVNLIGITYKSANK